jgi:hypothetical protein
MMMDMLIKRSMMMDMLIKRKPFASDRSNPFSTSVILQRSATAGIGHCDEAFVHLTELSWSGPESSTQLLYNFTYYCC